MTHAFRDDVEVGEVASGRGDGVVDEAMKHGRLLDVVELAIGHGCTRLVEALTDELQGIRKGEEDKIERTPAIILSESQIWRHFAFGILQSTSQTRAGSALRW